MSADLDARLEALPRVRLAHLPTPLERLATLSQRLGVDLLVKRDDQTGFALGGNKARKLEYIMAEALAAGAQVVVTTGGAQSNHARMVAAACARFGIACELFLRGLPGSPRQGNLLLDELFGARVTLLPTEEYFARIDQHMAAAAERARARGKVPYVIPLGGAFVTGSIGYVMAVREMAAQLAALGTAVEYIVTATGSCGTQAGLEVGVRLFYPRARVIGIAVSGTHERNIGIIASLASATAAALGVDLALTPAEIHLDTAHIGEGYAIPTADGLRAIRLLARSEALVLDPVYTGKAMAGLLALVENGTIPRGARVLFLHTGGSPALFAYAEAVSRAMQEDGEAGGV